MGTNFCTSAKTLDEQSRCIRNQEQAAGCRKSCRLVISLQPRNAFQLIIRNMFRFGVVVSRRVNGVHVLSPQLSVLSFTGSRNRYPVSDLKPKKRSGYESQAILGTVIHYIGWTVIFVGTTVIGYFVFDAACAEWTSCFFSFYVFAVLCMFFVIWRAELGARRDSASHLIRTYYRSRTRSMGADEGA